MKKTIKVSKYNEVDPKELKELFGLGAKLIKSPYQIGVSLNRYVGFERSYDQIPYSDDLIEINNVTLPLSIDGQYDCELTLNINTKSDL